MLKWIIKVKSKEKNIGTLSLRPSKGTALDPIWKTAFSMNSTLQKRSF